jgi:AmmeMemoRadiSam system protein B
MASLDRPKLRPLSGRRLAHEGQDYVVLEDPLGVFADPVLIPMAGYQCVVRHFDGQTPLLEIQARILRETGQLVTSAELQGLVDQLDRAMVLEGPTFAAFQEDYRNERTRPAAHAGRAYAGTERALRAQLGCFFADGRGSGPPRDDESGEALVARLRGILSPHIDFQRGGPVYTWSYKELVEQSDADTFVILGVAHQYCRHRFALTRKDFETPLGLARTDRTYVDRIAALAGDHLFEDELSHRTEHSIEFQVVFLQYLLGGRRNFSIVPILVGSFHDLVEANIDPIATEEVRRFVDALRAAESASGRKVAYIGGIDLSHVGREFGDPDLLDTATLDRVRGFDSRLLERAAAGDPAGWFGIAAAVNNRWRVCGLAATYTMLHAMGPAQGRLLKYDQAVDAAGTCCVSFASLAFDAPREPPTESETDARAIA